MTAHRTTGLWKSLPFFSRHHKNRLRAARLAKRSALRIETLENRLAMHGAALDLHPDSDSGALDTDNITNITSWTITATEVNADNRVRIMNGDTQLGDVNEATGDTRNFVIDASALADGNYTLTVQEEIDGVFTTVGDHPLTITLDRTAPTSTPSGALLAQAGSLFQFTPVVQDASAGVFSLEGETLPPGLTINPANGQLDWVPTDAEIGNTYSFGIKIVDLAGNEMESLHQVDLTVTPPVPGTPDLLDASDSGVPTDNVTNATTITFAVSGVVDGATLQLFADEVPLAATVVDQGGGVFHLTLDNLEELPEGLSQITVTQTVNGETNTSAALELTYDTTIAAITGDPATTGTVDAVYTFDAEHEEEADAGFEYALEGAPAGMAIDASGVITWTPDVADVGDVSFTIRATDLAGNTITRDVTVTVSAAALPTTPGTPDLVASSDSGNDSDSITNAATLVFTVSGIDPTASEVRLKIGDTIVGTQTTIDGSGTVEVTITNMAALVQGANEIRAEQVVDGVASELSAALTITYDTEIDPITGTPPTTGTVGAPITYDPGHTEEGQGLVYSIVGTPPTGVAIDAETGVVTWTPLTAQVGTVNFQIQATDAAGNSTTQDVSVVVSQPVIGTPGTPDLDASSDSGSSNSDNITNATTWTIVVSGVTAGATVTLFNGAEELISGVADGTSITLVIPADKVSVFVQGNVIITARQTLDEQTSNLSGELTVVKDTAVSAIEGTPAATASVGSAYTFDPSQDNEEPGTWQLVNGPANASINASTGVVTWTPSDAQIGLHGFQVRFTDVAGNTTLRNFDVHAMRPIPALTDHFHVDMWIYVNGVKVNMPGNLGINGTSMVSPIHTHANDNRVHIHPITGQNITQSVTLGDIFATWRTNAGDAGNNANATFSSNSLMGTNVGAGQVVRVWINGVLSTEYENYILRDNDDVIISLEAAGPADAPIMPPLPDVTVLHDSPLHVALPGYDPNGGTLTYEINISNPSVINGSLLDSGNRSLKITVKNYGTMTFYLFEDEVANTVARMIAFAEDGYWDNTVFHRIIANFMIQGGDKNGNGINDENLPETDDEFTTLLQHNQAGLISMAKSGDDTNTSQFFILDSAQRHLDFNHTIFGMLVRGDNVRDALNDVSSNASTGAPLTPVVIDDVSVFIDPQSGMLRLSAANGVTSGSSQITVKVTNEQGVSTERTFNATVALDTVNTPPFLNPVPPIVAQAGQPKVVQLTATDLQNHAVKYEIDAASMQGKPYTATINAQTGELTITPNPGFAGTTTIKVRVLSVNDVFPNPQLDEADSQVLTVTVTPAAPSVPDLQASSDLGFSSTDNLTTGGSWEIMILGVANNATVTLYHGDTVVGTATTNASGTSVTITVDSSQFPANGQVQLTAEQSITIDGVVHTSARSGVLTITKDTTAPAPFDFTNPVPTTAIIGAEFEYSFVNPDEGTNYIYSLVAPPSGAVIDPATGRLTWTPTAAQLGAHSFTVKLTDPAGNVREHTLNLSVISNQTQLVKFYVLITNLEGEPITQIEQGESFLVTIQVEDLRTNPEGVFAAYADVLYDAARAALQGVLNFGSDFQNGRFGVISTAGIIDEAGAMSNLSQTGLGGGKFDLFTAEFVATGVGSLGFSTNPSEDGVQRPVLLFGVGSEIPNSQIQHAAETLTVIAATGAVPDVKTVTEDTTNNVLNVLENDTIPDGHTGPLFIDAVSQPVNGGTVTISQDKTQLIFTPAADFTGITSFTYTVKTESGFEDTTTVTVNVTNINDPPTANDDTLSIVEDATGSGRTLNVLANDSILPDVNETLTIVGVTQPTTGGTVSIASDGKSLVFVPTQDFNGTVTFTYTINDGTNGSNDTATVTLTITPANDNPVAAADTHTVAEDSSPTTINVLANDNSGPDVGETLTVTAVTQGSQGGTITVGENGTNVVYTPKANFFGTETFTYTISDGNGGTATATVTVTVTPVNDEPTAVNDTATTIKNTGPLTVNVLANDSIAPDTGETLTITAVTQPTSGGTVAIAADGKSIIYTPTANFSGTVTFTYTINDGTEGSNDTATVTITVQDFIPSDIAGYVYIDANRNGVRDAGEVGIAGVTVLLTGTSSVSSSVNVSVVTQADGSYKFVNVAPGTYSITQVQPAFMVDAFETLGSHGGTKPMNDRMSFTIAQDSHLTNYNFGEFGRQAKFVTMKDFLTSTPVGGSMASINSSGAMTWAQLGQGFSASTTITGSLNSAKTHLTLNITENGQQYTTTIAMNDTSKIAKLGEENGAQLIRILGTRATLGFTPVTTSSSEASGEDTSSLMAAPSNVANDDQNQLPDPEGEPASSPAVASYADASNYDSSSTDSALAAALATSPTTPTYTAPAPSVVGPIVADTSTSGSNYGTSQSTVTPSSSSTDYGTSGSGSSLITTADDDLLDSQESDDLAADATDTPVSAQANDEAIETWEDTSWQWLNSQDEEDDDETYGASEEEAVDALMAEEQW